MQQIHKHCKIESFNCQTNTESHRSENNIPNLNLIWSKCTYFLESKWEENPWFEEFKLSSTWYPLKEKKARHIIQTSPHLWNYEITGISQKPSVQIIKGPLQVSAAGLYNRRLACHHKHNYSRFTGNTKGTKKERWQYKSNEVISVCIIQLLCYNGDGLERQKHKSCCYIYSTQHAHTKTTMFQLQNDAAKIGPGIFKKYIVNISIY